MYTSTPSFIDKNRTYILKGRENMKNENKLPKNIKKVLETISVPVYSNIRLVNGRIIAVIDDVIETPIEWIKEDGKDGKR